MKKLLAVLYKRFWNRGTLAAVIAFVLQQLLAAGVIDASAIGFWQQAAELVLGLLVVAGIFNNPANGKGYADNELPKPQYPYVGQ